MYTPANRKFMKGMDKTTLLKMREEQDMTNKDIAHAVGCSEVTIRNIIGAMPPEMRRRKFSENGKRNAINRSRAEGGTQWSASCRASSLTLRSVKSRNR